MPYKSQNNKTFKINRVMIEKTDGCLVSTVVFLYEMSLHHDSMSLNFVFVLFHCDITHSNFQ